MERQLQSSSWEQHVSLSNFKKFAPSLFRGTADPLKDRCWLEEVEKIFETLKCLEVDKVTFASFMLTGVVND